MDGGVSGANIDAAIGYNLIIAITPARQSLTPSQIEKARSSGSRVLQIALDAGLGNSPNDRSLQPAAAEAGLRQGAEIAETVRSVWEDAVTMSQIPRPVPDLGPKPISMDEYYAFTPEKIELLEGFLLYGPEDHEGRRDLLQLLLKNEGLQESVRLAPLELWQEALRRAYP
jgi:hypothetical protein